MQLVVTIETESATELTDPHHILPSCCTQWPIQQARQTSLSLLSQPSARKNHCMGKGHMINADQLSPTVQSKPQSHGCFLDLGAPITITKAIDHFSWGNQCFWWTMFLESTLIVQQTVLKVALGPIVDHVKDTRAIATPLVSSMAKGPPHGFQKHPGLQPHEDLWLDFQ